MRHRPKMGEERLFRLFFRPAYYFEWPSGRCLNSFATKTCRSQAFQNKTSERDLGKSTPVNTTFVWGIFERFSLGWPLLSLLEVLRNGDWCLRTWFLLGWGEISDGVICRSRVHTLPDRIPLGEWSEVIFKTRCWMFHLELGRMSLWSEVRKGFGQWYPILTKSRAEKSWILHDVMADRGERSFGYKVVVMWWDRRSLHFSRLKNDTPDSWPRYIEMHILFGFWFIWPYHTHPWCFVQRIEKNRMQLSHVARIVVVYTQLRWLAGKFSPRKAEEGLQTAIMLSTWNEYFQVFNKRLTLYAKQNKQGSTK